MKCLRGWNVARKEREEIDPARWERYGRMWYVVIEIGTTLQYGHSWWPPVMRSPRWWAGNLDRPFAYERGAVCYDRSNSSPDFKLEPLIARSYVLSFLARLCEEADSLGSSCKPLSSDYNNHFTGKPYLIRMRRLHFKSHAGVPWLWWSPWRKTSKRIFSTVEYTILFRRIENDSFRLKACQNQRCLENHWYCSTSGHQSFWLQTSHRYSCPLHPLRSFLLPWTIKAAICVNFLGAE